MVSGKGKMVFTYKRKDVVRRSVRLYVSIFFLFDDSTANNYTSRFYLCFEILNVSLKGMREIEDNLLTKNFA